MKKAVTGLLLSMMILLGISSAGNITVENKSSTSSCNSSETVNKYLYLSPGEYTVSDKPWDTFKNTVDSLIKKGSTSVQIWRNGVISDCDDWNTSSIVVSSADTNGASIIVNKDGCDFKKPSYTKTSNPTAIDAQIHYTIAYARVWEDGSKTYNGRLYHKDYTDTNWTCYPGGSKVINNQDCPNVTVKYVDETKYHVGECINYSVFRCGDGLVNRPGSVSYDNGYHYEPCDPADTSHAGWGDEGCSTSCKPLNSTCGDGKKTGNEECDYKDTTNKEGWGDEGCSTSCKPLNSTCGDGKKTGNEECDYKDTTNKEGWGDEGCSTSCKPLNSICGDGKKTGNEECDYKDTTNKEGWGDEGCSTSCKPLNSTCGDGKKTGNEECDYKDTTNKEGWGDEGCSTSCKPLNSTCGDGKKTGNEECDYKDTTNKEGWGDEGCSTSCKPLNSTCGDGKKTGNEECDYKDTTNKEGWGDEGCSTSCKPLNSTCGDGKKTGNEECDYKDTTNKEGWGDEGCSTSCKPLNSICGDGKKTGNEECDYKDTTNKEGWGDGCNTECKATYDGVECGTIEKKYNNNFPVARITPSTPGLCKIGSYVDGSMKGPNDATIGIGKYFWSCERLGVTVNCDSSDEYCGDGKVQEGNEACDPESSEWKNGKNGEICNENCEIESIKEPNLWIKKTFTNGDDVKTVKIGEEIGYKIRFGNNGNASATITSIKDFLPKNVEYISSKIYIVNGNNSHLLSGSEVIDRNRKVDGVYVDIYGGITLEANTEGYIILTGRVLTGNQDNRTNFACIYLNNEKIECDDAIHNIAEELMCTKPEIEKTSFGSGGGTTSVTCNVSPSGEKAEIIELDCGNGTKYTGSNVSALKKICTYPVNTATGSKYYSVVCTVNGKTKEDCKSTVTVEGKNGEELMCTKPEIEKTSFGSGGGTTSVTCNVSPSGEKAEIIELDCGNGTKYTGSNVSALKKICTYPANATTGSKSYSVVCTVNGKMKEDCKSTVTVEGKNGEELICTAPKGNYSLSSDGGETQLTCDVSPSGEKAELIELDCGEGSLGNRYHTGSNISSLSGVCKYPSNGSYDTDATYTAKCKVNNKNNPENECKSIIYVNKKQKDNPPVRYHAQCKTGYLNDDGYIVCEATDSKAHFKVNCNGTDYYYEDSYERKHEFTECKKPSKATCYVKARDDSDWKYNDNCKYEGDVPPPPPPPITGSCEDEDRKNDPICLFADPECFNVNEGNASIETGEILPFYMNINKDNSKWSNAYDYVYVDPNKYNPGDINNYKKILEDSNDKIGICSPGTVALNSMVCHYVIKNKNKIVFEGDGACLDTGLSMTQSPLVEAWATWQKRIYGQLQTYNEGNGYTFAAKVGTADSSKWRNNGKYGEYAFQINEVKYLQCDEYGRWVEGTTNSVCQSNFVFTDSYTVQKTPSGNLRTSANKLKDYLYLNGSGVFSELIGDIQATDYKPDAKVGEAIDKFISKYKKLAVGVKSTKTSSPLKANKLSKVPGKDIYFAEGDATIKGGNIKNPFTIVQLSGDTTIVGDIDHNVMLLTYGNIIFSGDCTKNQNVKGIYYASGNLIRKGVNKNNNTSHNYWCTKGGLQVQGVLIGNNFDELMKKSRSHLENRFKNDQKKEVINGASVVIEYSPSIFSSATMSPGAEDFITALSVYKK